VESVCGATGPCGPAPPPVQRSADERHQQSLVNKLCTAVWQDDIDTCRALIKKGVNINGLKTIGTCTALSLAASCGNCRMINLLLDNGASATIKDELNQYTPLHDAVRANWSEAVRLLLQRCDKSLLTETTKYGSTALHLAVLQNNLVICEMLLKYGATVNDRDSKGRTAFYYSLKLEVDVIARSMLKFSPDSYIKKGSCIHPLHMAAKFNHEAIYQTLIDSGVDLSMEDDHGHTAFQIAALAGHRNICKLLLEHQEKK
jgi:ankyrin repeat protein